MSALARCHHEFCSYCAVSQLARKVLRATVNNSHFGHTPSALGKYSAAFVEPRSERRSSPKQVSGNPLFFNAFRSPCSLCYPLGSNWLHVPSLWIYCSMLPHAYSTDRCTEHFKNLQFVLLRFTADKQLSDKNLTRSAKFKQDQARSTKGSPRITNHESAETQN